MHILTVAKRLQAGPKEPQDRTKAKRYESLDPHSWENQWFVKIEKWKFIKTES